MHFSASLVATLAITSTNAFSFSDGIQLIRRSIPVPSLTSRFLAPRQDNSTAAGNSTDTDNTTAQANRGGAGGAGACPLIWQAIAVEYMANFMGPDGQCTDDARAAIRTCFHDCATWTTSMGDTGGCDGSLILADEVYSRQENKGLEAYADKLKIMKAKYPTVSMADFIVMGSSVAIVACPGGPRLDTFIGRKDSNTAAPEGTLPSPFSDGDSLLKLFEDKGFSAAQLAALMGAHTASKAETVPNITAGTPQDTTPGKWDVNYYAQTYKAEKGMASFPSDISLSQQESVGPEMKKFVDNKAGWDVGFKAAMEKMQLLGGLDRGSMSDCTDFVPMGTGKRDMRGAPINARVR